MTEFHIPQRDQCPRILPFPSAPSTNSAHARFHPETRLALKRIFEDAHEREWVVRRGGLE